MMVNTHDGYHKDQMKSNTRKITRFDKSQALELLEDLPMGQLMAMAHDVRTQRFPTDQVTFVFDTNPNYTNICVTNCAFCAFCRKPKDADAYLHAPETVAEKVKSAQDAGATTVLLQGGHHPDLMLKDWLEYIDAISAACPDIHIHPFSPAEYVYMAGQENMPVKDLLQVLWDRGIRTIPGGGAEILTESVRQVIAKRKATSDQWLETCETAHGIGYKTTATMMFGHVETNADIIEHLFKLRALQDKTSGFTSFIPWSFKPGNTRLSKKVQSLAHPAKYVRIIAVARLVLDNFEHVQSSWFSESVPAGQLGLLAGADDFGGVLVEENVLLQAGHDRASTADRVRTIIKRSGFTPAQRDSDYNVIKVYDGPEITGTGG